VICKLKKLYGRIIYRVPIGAGKYGKKLKRSLENNGKI
jgi:hypothetical protein